MNKLDFESRTEGDTFVVSVTGELDMESSPRLLEEIRSGLKDASRIELELKGVEYVDSSGIAVLVHGFKLAHKRSVQYVIVDPSPQVMAVINLSQLHKFFTIRQAGDPA